MYLQKNALPLGREKQIYAFIIDCGCVTPF